MIVLILVLVEDGLRERLSLTRGEIAECLNPCSCGRWSQSTTSVAFSKAEIVLILVLVEDGLRGKSNVSIGNSCIVLILVLVEDGLRGAGRKCVEGYL